MSVQEIMLERGQLLATCAAQRDELTRAVQTWQGPLRIADGALVTANYLREHPAALAAVVTVCGRWPAGHLALRATRHGRMAHSAYLSRIHLTTGDRQQR